MQILVRPHVEQHRVVMRAAREAPIADVVQKLGIAAMKITGPYKRQLTAH
jgi:hypothetical protein